MERACAGEYCHESLDSRVIDEFDRVYLKCLACTEWRLRGLYGCLVIMSVSSMAFLSFATVGLLTVSIYFNLAEPHYLDYIHSY